MRHLDRHPWLWLLIGAALIFASQLRFGVGALAWLAPIPWLRYLRITSGWRSRALVMAAFGAVWTLTVVKIVTAPVPLAMAPLFGLPTTVMLGTPYLLWSFARPRLGERLAPLFFATSMVTGEWISHAFLPLGTWGAAANTQLDHLALLQLASVTGLHGVSFLVYWVAASAESALADRARWRQAATALASVVAVVTFGQARLALSDARDPETVRVATVDTDATFGASPDLPAPAELARADDALASRTREMARAGARMVVWPEGATLVRPDEETAFLARTRELARSERITLVAAYIIPIELEPLRYRNEYVLVTPEGEIAHRYAKHEPVPGEPAVRGEEPTPVYVSGELGRVSGAICYDYDFPRLGLAHGRLDVDLVALPSSDWRGIHPLHTRMAAVRAIEGGQSVLRSTRFGLSAGVDPYGRMRAVHGHFDPGARSMLVELPRHRVPTIYAVIGDAFPIAAAVLTLAALVLPIVRRYAARSWRSSPSPAGPSRTPASASASTSSASSRTPG
ncbi:MAG: hypothetical protein IT378_18895 [Sandaracinaceae bacterium]|nr:hypothetical protein [Sandaracinaceae bacterium]